MALGSVKSLGSFDPRQAYGLAGKPLVPGQDFASKLQQAIQEVDELQTRREQMVQDMIVGKTSEVHDVMIAAKESQLAFELLMEIRNKLLESYQEIMRMQV